MPISGVSRRALWLPIHTMRSSVRTLLIAMSVPALLVGVAAGCGRGSPGQGTFGHVLGPANAKANWNLAACEDLCQVVDAKAANVDALCAVISKKVSGTCGSSPLAYKGVPDSAVRSAALLDVVDGDGHHSLLALGTAGGVRVARSLGKGADAKALSAAPVDLPGMAPAGVELRLAIDGGERLFVCGVDGEGKTMCPVALQTAGKAPFQPMGAGLAGAVAAPAGWRAKVELGPQGYVAKVAEGDLPAGLAGEHAYAAD